MGPGHLSGSADSLLVKNSKHSQHNVKHADRIQANAVYAICRSKDPCESSFGLCPYSIFFQLFPKREECYEHYIARGIRAQEVEKGEKQYFHLHLKITVPLGLCALQGLQFYSNATATVPCLPSESTIFPYFSWIYSRIILSRLYNIVCRPSYYWVRLGWGCCGVHQFSCFLCKVPDEWRLHI